MGRKTRQQHPALTAFFQTSKQLIRSRDMQQNTLAVRLGCSASYLSQCLNCQIAQPNHTLIKDLAGILGLKAPHYYQTDGDETATDRTLKAAKPRVERRSRFDSRRIHEATMSAIKESSARWEKQVGKAVRAAVRKVLRTSGNEKAVVGKSQTARKKPA